MRKVNLLLSAIVLALSTQVAIAADNTIDSFRHHGDYFIRADYSCVQRCRMAYTGLECVAFTSDRKEIERCEAANEKKKSECLEKCY